MARMKKRPNWRGIVAELCDNAIANGYRVDLWCTEALVRDLRDFADDCLDGCPEESFKKAVKSWKVGRKFKPPLRRPYIPI